jgi:hypothetical protein
VLFVIGNDITSHPVVLFYFLNSQINKKRGKRIGARIDTNPDFQSPDIEQTDSCFVWMKKTALATHSRGSIFLWIISTSVRL